MLPLHGIENGTGIGKSLIIIIFMWVSDHVCPFSEINVHAAFLCLHLLIEFIYIRAFSISACVGRNIQNEY